MRDVFCLSVSDTEPTRERTLFSLPCIFLNNLKVMLTYVRTHALKNDTIHGLSFLNVHYVAL